MPKIAVFHGLFGEGNNWKSIARKIPAPTILVDLPNHGNSVHSSGVMTYDAMAREVAAQLNLSPENPLTLLGHSMGGKLAMRLALLFPYCVQALIVVDIAPKKYPPIHDEIFTGLAAIDQEGPASRSEADLILQKYEASPELRSFLLKNLIRGVNGEYHWKCNLPVIRENYAHILDWPDIDAAFDGPVLFIRGGQSPYIHDTDQTSILRLFPRMEIHTIMEAGHWLHVQAVREFLSCLNRFLFSQKGLHD